MQILIFANGPVPTSLALTELLAQTDFIIAADGGASVCKTFEVLPDILIGDFDSIESDLLKDYEGRNVTILRFSPHKDATDLELALDEAQRKHAEHIWIVGGLGDRWDMSIGNIMLAAAEKYTEIKISFLTHDSSLHILHPNQTYSFESQPDQTVSLIPLKGDVSGVTLHGFKYPLDDATITFGSSLGISNVTAAQKTSITHKQGILLCTQAI